MGTSDPRRALPQTSQLRCMRCDGGFSLCRQSTYRGEYKHPCMADKERWDKMPGQSPQQILDQFGLKLRI